MGNEVHGGDVDERASVRKDDAEMSTCRAAGRGFQRGASVLVTFVGTDFSFPTMDSAESMSPMRWRGALTHSGHMSRAMDGK